MLRSRFAQAAGFSLACVLLERDIRRRNQTAHCQSSTETETLPSSSSLKGSTPSAKSIHSQRRVRNGCGPQHISQRTPDTMVASKLEFAVQYKSQDCVDAVLQALRSRPGVHNVEASLKKQELVVDTSLPSAIVLEAIEETGRRAVLYGQGALNGDNLGAAVCALDGPAVKGLVRFVQVSDTACVIDGTVTGLAPGPHGFHIHEFGDLSNGCVSAGGHYNPHKRRHGAPSDPEDVRHVGDLGNIVADDKGRADFKIIDTLVNVWDIIGRSVVVHEGEDDLGRGGSKDSLTTGNAGGRLACGIIARAAGVFENSKRFCACDGRSIWDDAATEFY